MNRIAAPYVNSGNPLVLSMVPQGVRRVLDVGCGGGDNSRHLRNAHPGIAVVGLTHSAAEAEIAAPHMDVVHVIDLENGLSDAAMAAWGAHFDLLLFSHVLEHLIDPVSVLRRCLTRLSPGGHVLIAVPNVLEWRTRMRFLRGYFVYADHGILDRTHMRFFTYHTAPTELVAPIDGLTLLDRQGRGSAPLGPLRRIGPARSLCAALDHAGVQLWPNFCARETVMLARWQERMAT
ncbi:methyltransferase family protein [Roseinatronobacter thiooxidans]|uniref:Methyltransferase family protein n=1 Tax=Roseinatronobacter thiooxidans TaxID=121821 RepID=A0A2W7QEC8_9RHOB|nr:class I SAM-dependent methyltransferase [Roseinatronobacter thiooxidans]PZX45756.1 methyltransferase family protein [Roseinatronobacter thiooxidans]